MQLISKFNKGFRFLLCVVDILSKCARVASLKDIAERFIRPLKTKICKYMTSISKNVYLDKLDDIENT